MRRWERIGSSALNLVLFFHERNGLESLKISCYWCFDPMKEPKMAPNSFYRPSSLVIRKGKWYVTVTKPKELQFGNDRQARRSTGTSDRRQAEHLKHDLTSEIYAEFDRQLQRSDKVFEALRPMLEAEGINTRQWYTDGMVVATIGQDFVDRIAGADMRPKKDGKPVNMTMTVEANTYYDLCWLVSILGHAVPATVLGMLSEDDRAKVLQASQPSEPSTDTIIGIVNAFPDNIAKNVLDHGKTNPTIKLDQKVVIEGSTDPTLAMVIDDYLRSRPERSRIADRLQLKKWLNHRYGNKPLKQVDQYDAHEFLSEMGEELAKSSIGVLKAAMSNVFKWAMTRRDLEVRSNPFTGLDLREIGKDGIEKRPFTQDELRRLFKLDMTADDRTALAILVSTGMRGGELIQVDEVKSADGVLYLDLVDADVKTHGSRRRVPLRDELGHVTLPLQTNQNRLNQIIREQFSDPALTLHSLRHTFKDLARDADIPKELSDFITGHAQGDVAGGYGQGPSLKKRYEAIMSIQHPWLGW